MFLYPKKRGVPLRAQREPSPPLSYPASIKIKATKLVYAAIRNGSLVKQACSVCGHEKAEAHHEDYLKPLDVMWLCKRHHADRHIYLRANGIHTLDLARITDTAYTEYVELINKHKRNEADSTKNTRRSIRETREGKEVGQNRTRCIHPAVDRQGHTETVGTPDSDRWKIMSIRLTWLEYKKLKAAARKRKTKMVYILRELINTHL